MHKINFCKDCGLKIAVVICKECGKPLCGVCYKETSGYCLDCYEAKGKQQHGRNHYTR